MQSTVSILVVPREQFSKTAQSLESIYANTSVPFSLVYVDGNSPPHIRRYLEDQARKRGFTLLREDRYLTANVARNIGLPYCKGDYIAFLDNDVQVTPEWLEGMLSCAEETGAAVVGPLYLLGDPNDQIVHTAGAHMSITGEGADRTFHEQHRFGQSRVADVASQLKRAPIDLVEFHCLLARRDVVEEVGLDPELLSFMDHDDFCLAVKNAGYEVYTEPKAMVSHLSPPPIAFSDLHFYMLRWSNAWIDASVRRFAAKHQLRLDDDGLRSHYRYRDSHRLRLIFGVRTVLTKTLGWRACALVDRFANRFVFDRILENAVARH